MICKLCGGSHQLQYSHIIPSSFHKDTKKNGKNIKIITPPQNGLRKNQKDLAEYLLCKNCEGLLGLVETRSIPILKDISNGNRNYINSDQLSLIQDFIRSVFWRASVSNICKYKLPCEIEKQIENSLLNGVLMDDVNLVTKLSILTPVKKLKQGNGGLIIEPWNDFDIYGIVDHFVVDGLLYSMVRDNLNALNKEKKDMIDCNSKFNYSVKKSSKIVDSKINDLLNKMKIEGSNSKYQNIF